MKIAELQAKMEKARTVFTNLLSFKDWSFAAYKVEAHEKDVVMEAMSEYVEKLQKEIEAQKATEEESNDSTELCE